MFDWLQVWAKGDPLTHDHLNQAVEVLRQLATLTGGDGINVFQTPSGTTISLADRPPPAPQQVLVIITKNEDGDGVYSGMVGGSIGTAEINPANAASVASLFTIPPTQDPQAESVVVLNLAEQGLSGHMLTDASGAAGGGYIGTWYGGKTNEQPQRRVVLIYAIAFTDCTDLA